MRESTSARRKMKDISANFLAALQAARDGSIVPRRAVTFYAKDRLTGALVEVGFWTGDEDVVFEVVSGTTGVAEERTFYGALNLDIGEIPRVADLTTQTVSIRFSQVADIAQQLVRGYDIRLARVEIHDVLLDATAKQPVGPGEIAFLGQVDEAPIHTPAAGEEGDVTVSVISEAISMLSRTNPQKASYQGQKRRSGDEWGKYKGTVGTWEVPWGQKS